MRQTLFADIIVPLGVPGKYTYRVPEIMNNAIQRGQRVLVQFGKSRIYTGIVYGVHGRAPKAYQAKYISDLLDEEPVVTDLQLKFWDWIAFYYCANPGDVMNAALPSGLKLSSTSVVQLNPGFSLEESGHGEFTEKEYQVLEAVHASGSLGFEDIARLLELKSAQPVVSRLLKKKAVIIHEDVKEKYKPKLVAYVRLSEKFANEAILRETLDALEKKAFRQAEALLAYLSLQKTEKAIDQWVSRPELLRRAENAAFETGRLLHSVRQSSAKALSAPQEKALAGVYQGFREGKPVLLQGVTGSGKTEVYIRLIAETLAGGKQALFLVPEIALTTQLISRLRAVFGEAVGVYHSRFSESERVEIWNSVLDDAKRETQEEGPVPATVSYKVIIGARSSLFLPFKKLGLIIVDEEHDSSFKQQDPSPRYHARDAALYLATLHKAHVVLGTATPSVESYYNATQGKYARVMLPVQFVESGGTSIEICDLNYFQTSEQMKAGLTPPLFQAIETALKKKHQAILFQNRRGFAPYTECRDCGHVPHCVQCDVSLIYHKQQQKLVCHYCGYSVTPPKTCPACSSNRLHYKGTGTEKIEEDVALLFPSARIARMDLDSTRSKYAYKQLIDDFETGNIDILVGTQMVTKGLDFDNVTVVGIINADAMLNFPDFRSFERAFQVITQVRGRAGRSVEKGKVFVQTSRTDHKILGFVTQNDIEGFFADALAERKQYNYPPFARLIELSVNSRDPNEVNHLADELALLLRAHFAENVLGPEFPIVSKIRNRYYKRILIKIARSQPSVETRQQIFHCLNELQDKYKKWDYRVAVDVDPV
jgi:primosomal protein N' (replication factor Y) (superfamily II helicase)